MLYEVITPAQRPGRYRRRGVCRPGGFRPFAPPVLKRRVGFVEPGTGPGDRSFRSGILSGFRKHDGERIGGRYGIAAGTVRVGARESRRDDGDCVQAFRRNFMVSRNSRHRGPVSGIYPLYGGGFGGIDGVGIGQSHGAIARLRRVGDPFPKWTYRNGRKRDHRDSRSRRRALAGFPSR